MMGAVFSNITCRLIVAQMSSTEAPVFNTLLIPLAILVVAIWMPNGKVSLKWDCVDVRLTLSGTCWTCWTCWIFSTDALSIVRQLCIDGIPLPMARQRHYRWRTDGISNDVPIALPMAYRWRVNGITDGASMALPMARQ